MICYGIQSHLFLFLLTQDEYKGYFRVATTEQPKWGCVKSRRNSPCEWKRVAESKSQLSVFKFPEQDSTSSKMELVKVLDNLGVREEIKSVRFFDSKAVRLFFCHAMNQLSSQTNLFVMPRSFALSVSGHI